jgi:hypothetical protein
VNRILIRVSKLSGLFFLYSKKAFKSFHVYMMFSDLNIYDGTSPKSFSSVGVVSRFCSGLSRLVSRWSLNCKNNSFISPWKSCDSMVIQFKHDVRLKSLISMYTMLWKETFLATIEA